MWPVDQLYTLSRVLEVSLVQGASPARCVRDWSQWGHQENKRTRSCIGEVSFAGLSLGDRVRSSLGCLPDPSHQEEAQSMMEGLGLPTGLRALMDPPRRPKFCGWGEGTDPSLDRRQKMDG